MSTRILVMVTALALALTGCSGTGSEASMEVDAISADLDTATAETSVAAEQVEMAATETTAASAEAPAEEAQTEEAPAEDSGADEDGGNEVVGDGGVTGVLAAPTDLGRDIIFTAEITVAVDDVGEAGSAAGRVIQRFGGFLFGQDTTGGAKPRTVLVFKVFPEDFQAVLSELGAIGEVRNQRVSADDVTERVVDLRSRINTADASVERLRGFLENADDLETIAALENQLLQRETDLETLRGQLRTLEDQVALATIVLTLTEARIAPAVAVVTSFYPGAGDTGFACPGSPGLSVETGEAVTACFEIANTGDTPLVGITLADPVMGIDLEDLTVVSGDPTATLAPGESLMLSHELTVAENLRTRTTVTAFPAGPEGTALDEQPVANTTTATLEAVDPAGVTGFSEGLAASWDLLVSLGRMLMLVVAWLIPFSWVFAIAGWWLLRRRRLFAPTPTAPPPESEPADREPELV